MRRMAILLTAAPLLVPAVALAVQPFDMRSAARPAAGTRRGGHPRELASVHCDTLAARPTEQESHA